MKEHERAALRERAALIGVPYFTKKANEDEADQLMAIGEDNSP